MSEQQHIDHRQWAEALRWLVFVDEDIGAIEALLHHPPPSFRMAAFHCQQAVEKMAKAILVAHGVVAPKIHDLEELAFLVADFDASMSQNIRKLSNLTGWYIAVRYPDIEIETVPSLEDVTIVYVGLKALRQQIGVLAPKR